VFIILTSSINFWKPLLIREKVDFTVEFRKMAKVFECDKRKGRANGSLDIASFKENCGDHV